MSKMLFLDDETWSAEPITNGTHKYAEGAEILIRALALDDRPVVVRDLTPGGRDWMLVDAELFLAPSEYVDEIEAALADDQVEIYAHNSHFDRTVERHAGLDLPLHRVRDTMVQALAHSLPGSLGALCEVLKVPTDAAKDKAGKALIQLFCKPIGFRFPKMTPFREQHVGRDGESKAEYLAAKRAHKVQYDAAKAAALATWPGRATRETHPEEWRRFLVYAGQDIVAMRECHRRMPKWNYPNNERELALWHLDQQINDRGVPIDLDLARAAVAAVDQAQLELKARTVEMTGGEVESTTKRDELLEHVLAEYGVDLPDLTKSTVQRLVDDSDMPEGLRELLRVRLQASATSTSKYKVLMRATSSDSRLRGLLQFCGAARTGRWAGRLFQPQNLPSRGLLPAAEIEAGIEALKADCAHLFFPNVMHLTSSTVRGCIVAPPGKKLVVADLSNIEGRDQAWLAGEPWKLRAFREFDAGIGPDLYKMSYGKSFNVHPDQVTKDQRQIGKVQELALGYEGGVGAFVTFAAGYGIDLDALAEKAVRFIPGEVFGQAQVMLAWHREKGRDPAARLGLADRTWLVCESFKLGWRAGHAHIAAYWKELDATVRMAIEHPGTTYPCGKVRIRRDGAWLRIVLPSGRALCYPSPQLAPEKRKQDDSEAVGLEALETEQPATGRTKITYMGVHQFSRKWTRLDTYGGKLFENICQAVARDVMAHNMPAIEAAGYKILLTVHDEVICEAPDTDEFTAEGLSALLAANPPWAPDMPLAAAGFEAYRYKKD
jgi:DNA polymerase bacteriophage-type